MAALAEALTINSLPKAAGAVTAVFGALAIPALFEPSMPVQALIASVGLATALIALSVIDLRTFRLPDMITLPLTAAGVLAAYWFGWDTLEWRAISAAFGFLSAYLVARTYEAVRGRSGLGLGDAKLMAAAGAWTGGEGLATVVLYACAGALAAAMIARAGRTPITLSTAIPFGPFLAAGLWLVWLYGPLT